MPTSSIAPPGRRAPVEGGIKEGTGPCARHSSRSPTDLSEPGSEHPPGGGNQGEAAQGAATAVSLPGISQRASGSGRPLQPQAGPGWCGGRAARLLALLTALLGFATASTPFIGSPRVWKLLCVDWGLEEAAVNLGICESPPLSCSCQHSSLLYKILCLPLQSCRDPLCLSLHSVASLLGSPGLPRIPEASLTALEVTRSLCSSAC